MELKNEVRKLALLRDALVNKISKLYQNCKKKIGKKKREARVGARKKITSATFF